MTSQQLMLLAMAVYAVVLGVTIYFTRATTRRALAALAGGAVVAVAGFGVEVLCQALGVWRYPWSDTGYGSPLMYAGLVLVWTILALIGWRVTRRFGWRGQAVFLTAVTVLGTLRDYMYAWRTPELIAFAPGPATVLIDAACWAGLTTLAQVVMRLLAGRAVADRLARRPWEATEPAAAPDRGRITVSRDMKPLSQPRT